MDNPEYNTTDTKVINVTNFQDLPQGKMFDNLNYVSQDNEESSTSAGNNQVQRAELTGYLKSDNDCTHAFSTFPFSNVKITECLNSLNLPMETVTAEERPQKQRADNNNTVLLELNPINWGIMVKSFNQETLPSSGSNQPFQDENHLLQIGIESQYEKSGTDECTESSILSSRDTTPNLLQTEILDIVNNAEGDINTTGFLSSCDLNSVIDSPMQNSSAANTICNEIQIMNGKPEENVDYSVFSPLASSQCETEGQDLRKNETEPTQSKIKMTSVLSSVNMNSIFEPAGFSNKDSSDQLTSLTIVETAQDRKQQLQMSNKTDLKAAKSKTIKNLKKGCSLLRQQRKSNSHKAPPSKPVASDLNPNSCEESSQVGESSKILPCKLYRKIEKDEDILLNPDEVPVYEFYDEEEEKKKIEQKKEERRLKDIKERTCSHCNKRFPDAMDVLRHKRVAHQTKKIILSREEIQPYLDLKGRTDCPICFAKICPKGYKSLYTKHIMVHCDNYNFPCRVCGQNFRRYDHRQNHEARHIVPPEKVE